MKPLKTTDPFAFIAEEKEIDMTAEAVKALENHEFSDAVFFLENYLKTNPDDALGYSLLILAYSYLKNHSKTESWFQKAAERNITPDPVYTDKAAAVMADPAAGEKKLQDYPLTDLKTWEDHPNPRKKGYFFYTIQYYREAEKLFEEYLKNYNHQDHEIKTLLKELEKNVKKGGKQ